MMWLREIQMSKYRDILRAVAERSVDPVKGTVRKRALQGAVGANVLVDAAMLAEQAGLRRLARQEGRTPKGSLVQNLRDQAMDYALDPLGFVGVGAIGGAAGAGIGLVEGAVKKGLRRRKVLENARKLDLIAKTTGGAATLAGLGGVMLRKEAAPNQSVMPPTRTIAPVDYSGDQARRIQHLQRQSLSPSAVRQAAQQSPVGRAAQYQAAWGARPKASGAAESMSMGGAAGTAIGGVLGAGLQAINKIPSVNRAATNFSRTAPARAASRGISQAGQAVQPAVTALSGAWDRVAPHGSPQRMIGGEIAGMASLGNPAGRVAQQVGMNFLRGVRSGVGTRALAAPAFAAKRVGQAVNRATEGIANGAVSLGQRGVHGMDNFARKVVDGTQGPRLAYSRASVPTSPRPAPTTGSGAGKQWSSGANPGRLATPVGGAVISQASKWREKVRSGEATPGQLEGLREMGLLHTPQAVNREVRGIERGTRELSRKRGITHKRAPESESPYPKGQAVSEVSSPEVMDNPDNMSNRFWGARDRLQSRLWQRSKGLDRNDPRRAELRREFDRDRPLPEELPKLKEDPGEHARMRPHGPHQYRREVTVNPKRGRPADNALVRRHEVDEVLVGEPYVQATGGRAAYASHASPEVIAREAGHANFLYPDVASSPYGGSRGMRGSEVLAMERAIDPRTPVPDISTDPSNPMTRSRSLRWLGGNIDPQLRHNSYRKFYGNYYGRSPAQRRKVDSRAAAQYGRQSLRDEWQAWQAGKQGPH